MRLRVCPPMVVNWPPTHSTLPLLANVRTEAFALGLHDVATPVTASAAPTRLRAMPPSVVKSPPAYTTPLRRKSVRTMPFVPGFHASTDWSASTCARFARVLEPTAVNSPPMYQPPLPSGIAAITVPFTRGNPDAGAPDVTSTGTPEPVTG